MLLICRTLQDFKTTGVSDEIANMRLQYHEDKRRAYTLQVEDAIRHGVIEEVKNEFPQVKQATAMHRTTGSMGRTQQIYGGVVSSPRVTLSKHTMGFVEDYGLGSPPSTMIPDISLRDPLDQEFVLNRKMAKRYYEQQLQEKMANKRLHNQESEEKKKKDLADKEAKKEKSI